MNWLKRLCKRLAKAHKRQETAAEALQRPEVWSAFQAEMRADSFTEEKYREIYGDDEEAIRAAQGSWLRAGERVIESTRKLRKRREIDL